MSRYLKRVDQDQVIMVMVVDLAVAADRPAVVA